MTGSISAPDGGSKNSSKPATIGRASPAPHLTIGLPGSILLIGLAIVLGACSSAGPDRPQRVDVSPGPAGPAPPATPPQQSAISPGSLELAPVLVDSGGGRTLLQLADPLDEPDFYCVDVPGFGSSLDLYAALSAHTCKPGADDEIFLAGEPLPGNLAMPAYGLCLEAAAAEPASGLYLKECSESRLQVFSQHPDGSLRLADTGYCLAIAPGTGEPTGGPSHLRRDLALKDCAAVPGNLRSWRLPGPIPL